MGKLDIKLYNADFTIHSEKDDEYLKKIYNYYKKVAKETEKVSSIKSSLQVAILTGISICDELYTEKEKRIAKEITGEESQNQTEENDEISDKIQNRALEMIKKIDKVL